MELSQLQWTVMKMTKNEKLKIYQTAFIDFLSAVTQAEDLGLLSGKEELIGWIEVLATNKEGAELLMESGECYGREDNLLFRA